MIRMRTPKGMIRHVENSIDPGSGIAGIEMRSVSVNGEQQGTRVNSLYSPTTADIHVMCVYAVIWP